ncbi:Uncharacterised protein [Mycobacteroides abscessus]|nr:Uncharacterised protein [Mycobacteroides abscessus]
MTAVTSAARSSSLRMTLRYVTSASGPVHSDAWNRSTRDRCQNSTTPTASTRTVRASAGVKPAHRTRCPGSPTGYVSA